MWKHFRLKRKNHNDVGWCGSAQGAAQVAAGNPCGDAIAVKAVIARQPKHVLTWLFFVPSAPIHAHRAVHAASEFVHGKLGLLTLGAAVPL